MLLSKILQILYGNLAPEGSVAKITGKEGLQFRGPARVFDSEEDMLAVVAEDPQQLKVWSSQKHSVVPCNNRSWANSQLPRFSLHVQQQRLCAGCCEGFGESHHPQREVTIFLTGRPLRRPHHLLSHILVCGKDTLSVAAKRPWQLAMQPVDQLHFWNASQRALQLCIYGLMFNDGMLAECGSPPAQQTFYLLQRAFDVHVHSCAW